MKDFNFLCPIIDWNKNNGAIPSDGESKCITRTSNIEKWGELKMNLFNKILLWCNIASGNIDITKTNLLSNITMAKVS